MLSVIPALAAAPLAAQSARATSAPDAGSARSAAPPPEHDSGRGQDLRDDGNPAVHEGNVLPERTERLREKLDGRHWC